MRMPMDQKSISYTYVPVRSSYMGMPIAQAMPMDQ